VWPPPPPRYAWSPSPVNGRGVPTASHEADLPPFPCSRCGTAEYVRVKFHHPSAGDYGHLVVRRPAGIRRTQTWRSVKLGDEV
jgi:hypothetical protein